MLVPERPKLPDDSERMGPLALRKALFGGFIEGHV